MEVMTVVVAVLFLVVVGLVIAVWALSRQVGILFERVSPLGALVSDAGPAVGAPSPNLQLTALDGAALAIGANDARSTLLFFLSPSCPVCKKLLPALRSISAHEKSWLRLVFASDGNAEEHARFVETQRLDGYPYVLSAELGLAFRVNRLPFAVLIDESGTVIAKGLVNNREQIESLFNAKDLGVASIQKYLQQPV